MEIAVVYSFLKPHDVNTYISAIKEYFSNKNHKAIVTCFNVEKGEYPRLLGSKFLILLAETFKSIKAPLSLKLDPILERSNKPIMYRGLAFVKHKGPLWKNRALLNAMKALEKQGIIVVYSDYLTTKEALKTSLEAVRFE